jgi:thiamine biosynthesis lipoprotein
MIHRLNFRALGTDILVCVDNGADQAPAALDDVPRWFADWEQTLSRFRADSELSRLNQMVDQPIRVSDVLWDVFQSSRDAAQLTEGLVTPTVLDAMLGAGYDRDFASLALQQSAALAMRERVSPLDAVIFDAAAQTIQLPVGVHLDFGGIAKGWIAHQTAERLKAFGATLVNCGGDIAISGALLNGEPWEIGVYRPFDREGDYAETLYFDAACGVASSATDRRRWMQGGQTRHHIIDPRTGLPAETDVVHATVVAANAVEAEAAAKSVLIRGSWDGLGWLESRPELAGLVILENGEILYSQRMMEYL